MTLGIGVVIVSYNSAREVITCLESLLLDRSGALRIVVVDNASPDGAADQIDTWIVGQRAPVELVRNSQNGGYAFGVNSGLSLLSTDPQIAWFWILNPDMTVPTDSIDALRDYLQTTGPFSLLGGRVVYSDGTNRLQTDGGLINLWTGVTHNVNLGGTLSAPPPDPQSLDFIMGGNMVASRAFLERVGPMREDFFLYYEEVDWALRRPADLPLAICAELIVHHGAGTSIGSATLERGASAAAQFWKHRARLLLLWRHNPIAVPVAVLWSLAKSLQLLARSQRAGAVGLLKGTLSGLRAGFMR